MFRLRISRGPVEPKAKQKRNYLRSSWRQALTQSLSLNHLPNQTSDLILKLSKRRALEVVFRLVLLPAETLILFDGLIELIAPFECTTATT